MAKTTNKDETVTPEYVISGIWYTKPVMTRDSAGEVAFGRVGKEVKVGESMQCMDYKTRKVERIDYNAPTKEFYIFMGKDALWTIPYTQDIEIFYTKK